MQKCSILLLIIWFSLYNTLIAEETGKNTWKPVPITKFHHLSLTQITIVNNIQLLLQGLRETESEVRQIKSQTNVDKNQEYLELAGKINARLKSVTGKLQAIEESCQKILHSLEDIVDENCRDRIKDCSESPGKCYPPPPPPPPNPITTIGREYLQGDTFNAPIPAKRRCQVVLCVDPNSSNSKN